MCPDLTRTCNVKQSSSELEKEVRQGKKKLLSSGKGKNVRKCEKEQSRIDVVIVKRDIVKVLNRLFNSMNNPYINEVAFLKSLWCLF